MTTSSALVGKSQSTLPRCGEAEQRLDQRALAGPVRADDRHQRALRDLHVDIPEHRLVAIGDRQVLNHNRHLLIVFFLHDDIHFSPTGRY